MKKDNSNLLKQIFYEYWMTRVPELNELEALDHLAYDLQTLKFLPFFGSGKTSRQIRKFLKDKGVKFVFEWRLK